MNINNPFISLVLYGLHLHILGLHENAAVIVHSDKCLLKGFKPFRLNMFSDVSGDLF